MSPGVTQGIDRPGDSGRRPAKNDPTPSEVGNDHDALPRAKRLLLGEPLTTEQVNDQLLPKRMALPIFASDALSSVAYGPQEMLMIMLIGGTAFLALSPWVAAAVVVLLVVVVASYRQIIRAYPSGGGDFEVVQKNLGEIPSVVVAAALLVDYILTVAVSIASGVDNIISAFPDVNSWRVPMAIAFVVLIIVVNLRGVREASTVFAIPTYVFIGSVGLMVATGLVRVLLGDAPVAASADYAVHAQSLSQAALILVVLRAFSSGCSALTGVEAVSNGVPAFRLPKIRNAQTTLTLMGTIAALLFAGLTTMAIISGVRYAENPCDLQGFDCSRPQPSVMAQVAAATFGAGSLPFFIIQAASACVLLLAANTAFNGFPLLGSVLAREGYVPKALNTRGDRLVFSNGMILLGVAAMGVLLVFNANLTSLIQLYIIGVFVSFSLGQLGMVTHWRRRASEAHAAQVRVTRDVYLGFAVNLIGAVMTIAVLIVVTVTKFTHGAWMVFFAIPVLSVVMLSINRYYRNVEATIAIDDVTVFGSSGDVAIVLVSRLQKPALKAIDYALAARHDTTLALHIALSADDGEELHREWQKHVAEVPLIVVESPYRTYAQPIEQFINEYRALHGPSVVTVYLPQYIVGHWWERILHNRRARRIAAQLMLVHGVTISLVPWLLHSSRLIPTRRTRPLPGQQRGGHVEVVTSVSGLRRRAHRDAGPP